MLTSFDSWIGDKPILSSGGVNPSCLGKTVSTWDKAKFSLCAHAFHHRDYTDSNVHDCYRRMLATESWQAYTVLEDGM